MAGCRLQYSAMLSDIATRLHLFRLRQRSLAWVAKSLGVMAFDHGLWRKAA